MAYNYEDSYNELKRIQKHLGGKSLTINFDKLDGETQNELRSVILNTVAKREREVFSNIQNSTNNTWL